MNAHILFSIECSEMLAIFQSAHKFKEKNTQNMYFITSLHQKTQESSVLFYV